ncbi:MAG: hypothetical protein US43_C0003G0005 [Candidatus Levybacteria bacterium GW2011_GWA1_37_16]|nr:MAG: hypothetical protein US43_C0003G0005 [Candidatus Levybacteria bacterium GW2011_GWA1_37_16]
MKNFQKGQSLVEIIIVMGLSIIILPALLTGLISSRQGKAQQSQRTQAVYLLNETVDAVRSVRERGWAGFAVNGIFHTAIASGSWILSPGLATINGLTQSVVVEDVNRDSGGAITSSGGTLDPSSKKVDISISWEQPYLSTVSATLFLTRYLENNSFTQTTAADFDVGTKSGTIVTNTAGGEVTLGAGGYGDWCAPNLSITALDLPKSGAANALTAIEGKAFAGTGNDSSGVSFANIAITNTNPPTANITGTFDGYKTNAVFGETNYAYIATDNNSKEVIIVDLATNPYTEAGYFNAPFNADGNGVFVAGNTGFMTTDHFLYSFNLSSRSGSRPQLGSVLVTLFGNLQKVYIVGNYAYIAVDGLAAKELSIIDISNPSNMSEVGYADVNSAGGKEVYVNSSGTRAYLATGADTGKREFFVIDVSSKNGSRPILGSYEAQGMSPKGVTVVTGNKAILVGTNAEEYQVIDVSNESAPVRCGGLNIDSGVNGISSVLEQDGDAYSYIVTGDISAEFKIIEGGPGGQYASAGTFISGPFDAGYQTAFNRFDVSVNRPNVSDIQFQVAVAPAVGGNCSEVIFDFVGPGATSSDFFTTSVTSGIQSFSFVIPPSLNPGRCFKYKAFLSTTDPLSTPIFYDMTGNYSP